MTSSAEDRPYHHGDLERALVDAAIDIVRKSGTAPVSLRAIARAAGVSHAAPYHHFPDRQSLLRAVSERALEILRAAMLEAMARHSNDPLRQFQAAGVAYILFAVKEPHLFRLILAIDDARLFPSIRQQCQQTFGGVRRLVEEAIIQATREEVDTIAMAAWSLVHGVAQLALAGQFGESIEDIERAARQITSMFLTGMKARTPGSFLSW